MIGYNIRYPSRWVGEGTLASGRKPAEVPDHARPLAHAPPVGVDGWILGQPKGYNNQRSADLLFSRLVFSLGVLVGVDGWLPGAEMSGQWQLITSSGKGEGRVL